MNLCKNLHAFRTLFRTRVLQLDCTQTLLTIFQRRFGRLVDALDKRNRRRWLLCAQHRVEQRLHVARLVKVAPAPETEFGGVGILRRAHEKKLQQLLVQTILFKLLRDKTEQ